MKCHCKITEVSPSFIAQSEFKGNFSLFRNLPREILTSTHRERNRSFDSVIVLIKIMSQKNVPKISSIISRPVFRTHLAKGMLIHFIRGTSLELGPLVLVNVVCGFLLKFMWSTVR